MKLLAIVLGFCLGFNDAKVLPRSLSKRTLGIRGGAVLPSEPTANFAATVSAANGALLALAPGKACDAYGLTKSPLAEWLGESAGFLMTEIAVIMRLSLNGMSAKESIGWGCFTYVIHNVKNILNETPQKFGTPVAGQYVLAAIQSVVGYSCFTGADWAGGAIKFYVGWCLLNGFMFALAPTKSLSAWGYTGGATETELWIFESFGFIVLSTAVMVAALGIFDMSPQKAIAGAFVPTLFNCAKSVFVSCDKLGMPKAPQVAWLAMTIAFIVSCGLD